jgi:hypothetical protein
VSIICCLVGAFNSRRSSSPEFSTATQYWLNLEFWVTLQIEVYRQLVRLGIKPPVAHDQIFTLFSTLSDERDGFVSYEEACPLSNVRIAHVACYLEIFPVLYIPVLCQYRHCKTDHVCPLWREDGSVIYSYSSLSLSGPSPADLMATSYFIIWDYWVPLRLVRLQWKDVTFLQPRDWVKVKITLRLTVSQYVLMSNPFWFSRPDVGYCWRLLFCLCGTPSLTRDRVCRLSLRVCIFKSSSVPVILRQTVSRPVLLGVGPTLGLMSRFKFSLFDNLFIPYVGSPLWREVEVEVNLRPTINRPVCLGVIHPKSKWHYDRQSVGQFVPVSCPFWSRWPDVTFIWVTITFFIFHVALSDERTSL